MANIDTLAYYEQLIAAGNNEEQARAHVYALSNNVTGLATKEDLNNLEKRIDLKISNLDNKMSTHLNLIERVGGSLIVAVLVLLLKMAIWS